MILLHPPGGKVPNHGTPVTTLIATEQEETIAWRAPRCSGSVSKFLQCFNDAILNLSDEQDHAC